MGFVYALAVYQIAFFMKKTANTFLWIMVSELSCDISKVRIFFKKWSALKFLLRKSSKIEEKSCFTWIQPISSKNPISESWSITTTSSYIYYRKQHLYMQISQKYVLKAILSLGQCGKINFAQTYIFDDELTYYGVNRDLSCIGIYNSTYIILRIC